MSHEDVVMLVLSWHFKAETMCEFSQKEFEDGVHRNTRSATRCAAPSAQAAPAVQLPLAVLHAHLYA